MKTLNNGETINIARNVSQDKSRPPLLKKISGRSETTTLVDSTPDVILVGDEQKSFAISGILQEAQHLETRQNRN